MTQGTHPDRTEPQDGRFETRVIRGSAGTNRAPVQIAGPGLSQSPARPRYRASLRTPHASSASAPETQMMAGPVGRS